MKKTQRFAKLSLFIFGSFSFGWILGIVLHELGHAVAMWLTGGIVDRITITPFSWSYTYYGSTPKYPQFTTWSGTLLGSLFGAIILLISSKKATPYVVPFLFMGVSPMLNGGGYYVIDPFISKRGDPTSLVRSGVPMYIVLGVGILLLALGAYLVVRYIHWSGIEQQDSLQERLIIFGSGILPYFVLAMLYSMVFEPDDMMQSVIVILMVLLFVVLVAFVSSKYPKLAKNRLSVKITRGHVMYASVLGVLAIVVPHLIF